MQKLVQDEQFRQFSFGMVSAGLSVSMTHLILLS
jgi:hypothetical protein